VALEVSKLTEVLDALTDDDATTLAGILFVADAWSVRPRHTAQGGIIPPEKLQATLRQRLADMQRPLRATEG